MTFKPRWYQEESIAAAKDCSNGIIVLPTGSGKSIVISGIANSGKSNTLVLQPSREILESNVAKIIAAGRDDIGIYSASAGSKSLGTITYATIGSIIKCLELFKDYKTIIIDECHLVNPKGGMYEQMIKELNPTKLIGLTATPYRQATNSYGTTQRILTRTRPSIFKSVIYCVNPIDLIKEGFLSSPIVHSFDLNEEMLKPNTTGGDFLARSIVNFTKENSTNSIAVEACLASTHESNLIFADSVADSEWIRDSLNSAGISAESVSAKTKPALRKRYLNDFENGNINAVVNVGTLTTGYDFPALESVIDARPIMSAALHYQKFGRVVRPFNGMVKNFYDIAGNVKRLGNPMLYELRENMSSLPEIYNNDGRVTSIYDEKDSDRIMGFGKYKGSPLHLVPSEYLEWACGNLKKNDMLHAMYGEMMGRQIREIRA